MPLDDNNTINNNDVAVITTANGRSISQDIFLTSTSTTQLADNSGEFTQGNLERRIIVAVNSALAPVVTSLNSLHGIRHLVSKNRIPNHSPAIQSRQVPSSSTSPPFPPIVDQLTQPNAISEFTMSTRDTSRPS